jgi:hypothetical protein
MLITPSLADEMIPQVQDGKYAWLAQYGEC